MADVALDGIKRITDEELMAGLKRLVRTDQTVNARLLVHLGEVDSRGLYREYAYASMFVYCVEELRMFEAQAYLRIQAARLGRRFPLALELLAQGALTLTAIKLLGPHLTEENHAELLERASGKRKREVELLVAEIAPKPDVRSRTRKLPEPRVPRATRPDVQVTPVHGERHLGALADVEVRQRGIAFELAVTAPIGAEGAGRGDAIRPLDTTPAVCEPRPLVAPEGLTATPCLDANVQFGRNCETTRATSFEVARHTSSSEALVASRQRASDSKRAGVALDAPRPRSSTKPLSPGRYRVEFTAGQALHDKLEQLQDLLRHQVPDGDLAAIVERAADLLIEQTMKQRFAQTRAAKKTPTAKPRNAKSRYIPRAVVREVHQRDAGQCTFVSADGKRCSERGFLELHHHDRPFAKGGEATVENLRLVCRAHNALFADRDYGRTFMRAKRRQAHGARAELVPAVPAVPARGASSNPVLRHDPPS